MGYLFAIVIFLLFASVCVLATWLYMEKQMFKTELKIKDDTLITQHRIIEALREQKAVDDETIETLTRYVKDSIKEEYKNNDRLKIKEEKDINEYGEQELQEEARESKNPETKE